MNNEAIWDYKSWENVDPARDISPELAYGSSSSMDRHEGSQCEEDGKDTSTVGASDDENHGPESGDDFESKAVRRMRREKGKMTNMRWRIGMRTWGEISE